MYINVTLKVVGVQDSVSQGIWYVMQRPCDYIF